MQTIEERKKDYDLCVKWIIIVKIYHVTCTHNGSMC